MTGPQTPGAARPVPQRRWVTVRRIEQVTPRVIRLRLQGDDLATFEPKPPGAHVKLVLPRPGIEKPAEALRYEGRTAIFADGVTPPFLRTYTPLHFDRERLELEVEFLIHDDGMASDWVQRAKIGDAIMVAGPGGGWDVPADGDWYIVAADDTAIPAAGQVLGAIAPGARRLVAFEVVGEQEVRPVPSMGDGTAWLFRGNDAGRAGALIEEWVRTLELPTGRGYAWIACEAGAMRRIRRHLIHDRGLAPDQLVTRGYWRRGTPDHPDGDYGQEEIPVRR